MDLVIALNSCSLKKEGKNVLRVTDNRLVTLPRLTRLDVEEELRRDPLLAEEIEKSLQDAGRRALVSKSQKQRK